MKCPKCHSKHVGIDNSGIDWMTFECAQCGNFWTESAYDDEW